MKKLLFYSFFVVSALSSCDKKDNPAPAASVEGKWNLDKADMTLKSLFGNEDEAIDYKSQGVFLELKSNNKFSTNLVLSDEINDLLIKGDLYESDYELKGSEITLKIYDNTYKEYLPVKLKIQSSDESKMVLQFTKAELAELMKAYDKLDGSDENSQMLGLVTSLNLVLTFTK
ncbi:MAG: hypothetical protein KF870_15215 [Leadbetterella sp.]|nr:hypothetical protein [Leadbetterella sp.]